MTDQRTDPVAALVKLAAEGRELDDESQPVMADADFNRWVYKVSEHLEQHFGPESALEWQSLSDSPLVHGGHYYDDEQAWRRFQVAIGQRLNWLAELPKRLREQASALEKVQKSALAEGRREIRLQTTARAFIDPSRIEELKQLHSDKFDFSKMIRLCEELNASFATESYFAVAMLGRALVDHVPPIFDQHTLAEVANNYAGTKSFKASIQTLERSLRNIADQHLHSSIRSSETLPNARQVDFGNDLDVLLAEIVRINKSRPVGLAGSLTTKKIT